MSLVQKNNYLIIKASCVVCKVPLCLEKWKLKSITIKKKSNRSTFTSTPYKLVITEKPSVAQAISAVLGAKERRDGCVGNGYIVSWCVGHLVELAQASAYDENFAKWRLRITILPKSWRYTTSQGKKKRFDIRRKLLNDKDAE